MARDDFSLATSRALANRVALRCSNPDCRAITAGPQVHPSKALNIGVAAHITSAAEGGPRYNPSLTAAQRKSAENGLWLCQTCGKLVDNDALRFTERLLREWKQTAERDALAVVGKARTKSATSSLSRKAEAEIKRNLALRDTIRAEFLKPPEQRRKLAWTAKPYERLAVREVLLRSVTDTHYPRSDPDPKDRMSSWVKCEVYDLYHNGIVVIIHLDKGVIDRDGNWAIISYKDYDLPFDEERYREVKIWTLGRVPWRNIRHVDFDGDEYYMIPHLFCRFEDNGMPYEDFTYALCASEGAVDWPLDVDQRFTYRFE